MSIRTIFDACRPRGDVVHGTVAEADFAADLAQVVTGGGSPEYVDPVRFFANTYPTRGLKNLLANVCRRLSGVGGEAAAIFRLDTSYGGGKTHGLIAQLRDATVRNLEAGFELTFADGLPMAGDAAETFTERLSRFAGGAAYVSATALAAAS